MRATTVRVGRVYDKLNKPRMQLVALLAQAFDQRYFTAKLTVDIRINLLHKTKI